MEPFTQVIEMKTRKDGKKEVVEFSTAHANKK